MPLTSDQTESLVRSALHGSPLQRASALFELVKAIADPKGETDRYDCALDAMRAIDPQTLEYEEWFKRRVASSENTDIAEEVTA